MTEYDFTVLFGSHRHKDFGYIGDGLRVVYPVATREFPIGYINDPNGKSINDARIEIEKTLHGQFGPVAHISLDHEDHNLVDLFRDGLASDSVTRGDGLIVKRTGEPFVIETMLADCACVVIWNKEWVGYMHVGRKEVLGSPSLIDDFFKLWPESKYQTRAWIGPHIHGHHYEFPGKNVPQRFKKYVTETSWGTQGLNWGSDIIEQLSWHGNIDGCYISGSDLDPFRELDKRNRVLSSARWYERESKKTELNIPCPRNAAILFVEN